MNTKSKTEHIPHSTQFEALTKKLLCLFSACGVIPSLSREEIEHYAALAGFHDIGKGAIPPEILDKPAFPRAQAVRMIVTGACGTFCPDMAVCFEQNIRGIFPLVYLCKTE